VGSSNKSEEGYLEEFLNFEEMKNDLEGFRSAEMTSFQKVNHFFTNMISDPVYYYVNC